MFFFLISLLGANKPVRKESNGLAVIYSWGKVCINMCQWDCNECLEWNEEAEAGTPVENGDVEFDEVWLENDDGTRTNMRFPLKSAQTAKTPKHDLPKRPSVDPVPEANVKVCTKWESQCKLCMPYCVQWKNV